MTRAAVRTALDRVRRGETRFALVRGDIPARGRVAIFPGTFDPLTVAHLAVAEAASQHAEVVVFAVPNASVGLHVDPSYYCDRGVGEVLGALEARARILVAPRAGCALPSGVTRMVRLDVPARFADISSSDVRGRIAKGEDAEHLLAGG